MTDDRELQETDQGWTIRLDGRDVSQILIDYRYSLRFGGGAEVVIEAPFTLRSPNGERVIDPVEISQLAPALTVLHQIVRSATATRDGRLVLVFVDGQEIEVGPIDSGENWQVLFPNGRMLVGLPGGDIAAFPAREGGK